MNWRRFGIHKSSEDKIWDTLSRVTPIDALGCVIRSLGLISEKDLKASAIVLDTNVLLHLSNHRKSDDIIDYLLKVHQGPLIIPGQAIQGLWNNHINVSLTHGSKLKEKFESLRGEMPRDIGSVDILKELDVLLDAFTESHVHIFADKWVEKLVGNLEILSVKAKVPFVDRVRFANLATIRKSTKTPPGFKDESFGDFFIWADGLLGIEEELRRGLTINQVIVFTGDRKRDWITNGRPHPILVAEAEALFSVHLKIYNIEEFALKIV